MSNLLKFNSVVLQDNETRVINSNELLEKKLQRLREEAIEETKDEEDAEYTEDEFTEGLDSGQMEALLGENAVEGIENNIIKAEPAVQEPTREEMLAEVQAEIDSMLEQAGEEAAAVKESAYEEGYRSGLQAGQQEISEQLNMRQRELQDKEQQMEAYYQNKINEIEPMFINVLTDVYAHVFHVEMDQFKEAILSIVDDIISGSEGNKDFILRVSEADYLLVSGQKERLLSHAAGNATMEIIEDKTLASGDCLLETGGGIFDCGITTQLEELTKELKLLSYKRTE